MDAARRLGPEKRPGTDVEVVKLNWRGLGRLHDVIMFKFNGYVNVSRGGARCRVAVELRGLCLGAAVFAYLTFFFCVVCV